MHQYILVTPNSAGYGYFTGFRQNTAAKPSIVNGVFAACKVYADTPEDHEELASDLVRLRARGFPLAEAKDCDF